MIVYLARDIPAFVMYCVNGESGSSLLIESTDSMINTSLIKSLSQNSFWQLTLIHQVPESQQVNHMHTLHFICIQRLFHSGTCVCSTKQSKQRRTFGSTLTIPTDYEKQKNHMGWKRYFSCSVTHYYWFTEPACGTQA